MTGPNVTTATQATPNVANPGAAGGVPGITTDASGNITGLISPTGNTTLVGSAVQVFTASGTWTHPGAGRTVRVFTLVVLGSSLTVMSGLRYVRHASSLGIPVVIVNQGATRGDELATARLDAPLGAALTALARELGLAGEHHEDGSFSLA